MWYLTLYKGRAPEPRPFVLQLCLEPGGRPSVVSCHSLARGQGASSKPHSNPDR